jgi:hypothetical protein
MKAVYVPDKILDSIASDEKREASSMAVLGSNYLLPALIL